MATVAAIVLNTVTRDARVLKEADTLAGAGHLVTIIGLADRNNPAEEERRASGVRIVRVDATTLGQRRIRRVRTLLPRAAAVVAICAVPLFALLLRRSSRSTIASACVAGSIGAGAKVALRQGSSTRTKASGVYRFVRNRAAGQLVKRLREGLIHEELGRIDPDVVHCHDLPTLGTGVRYARRHPGVRVVYDSHEIFEEVSQLSRRRRLLSRIQQRHHSRHVDAFITVNESIRDLLNERYPSLPPGVVVKNATALELSDRASTTPLRTAVGAGPDTRIILFHGGLARFRGLEHLLNAAPLIPDWLVVFMGWGPLETELRRVARERGYDNVRFLPGVPHDDLLDWASGATLGAITYENVCLNHWYCSPNKLWEYPAAGVPILASAFPEMRRTITTNGIGVVLDEEVSAAAIARAVQALTDEDLHTMRTAAARFAADDNWTVYALRLVDVYASLSENARAGHQ